MKVLIIKCPQGWDGFAVMNGDAINCSANERSLGVDKLSFYFDDSKNLTWK